MNFFEQQDRARRHTRWLLVLLAAAVLSLIAVTVLAVTFTLYFLQVSPLSTEIGQSFNLTPGEYLSRMLRSELTVWVGVAVVLVVFSGSAYKTWQLQGSGQKVAEALGGNLIPPNTQNPAERKILNVVEEMAIASGSPVPLVYVLEDATINAFAAGMDRRSAVIGVTRGCIERLDRNELQGVIAHEFSHIHFGDMRINLRLVGILHGILLLGLIGSHMIRSRSYNIGSNRQRRGREYELGIGLILVILGYVGVFFGGLIKAAISRQREYLADASAVQFTRNPSGIANALKKIAALPDHSWLSSPNAPDFNHFYFSQGIRSRFRSFFATHPPLEDRIRRVEPRWDGSLAIAPSASPQASQHTSESQTSPRSPAGGNAVLFSAIELAGQTTPTSLDLAHTRVAEIGPDLRNAAHEPFSARALIYGLLLDPADAGMAGKQLAWLQKNAHPATYKTLDALRPQISELPRELRLPLMELSIPALKLQSQPQYRVFKRNLAGLISQDQKISLFEWCIYRSVTHSCEEASDKGSLKLKDVLNEARLLATATLACSHPETKAPLTPMALQLGDLTLKTGTVPVPIPELEVALNRLCQLHPLEKPGILKMLTTCITADKQVSVEEMELFRAVADALNCPVPLQDLIARST